MLVFRKSAFTAVAVVSGFILFIFMIKSQSIEPTLTTKGEHKSAASLDQLYDTNTKTPIKQGKFTGEKKRIPEDDYDLGVYGVDAPIMPKMPNATLKAEIGRASWKLFHTILARYPEDPTQDQRKILDNFIQLYVQVYPCGDCAVHFQRLIKKFPPQTSGRVVASQWGCHLHNKVNEHLKKPIYDCSKILENYDCGCGEEPNLAEVEAAEKLKKQEVKKGLT